MTSPSAQIPSFSVREWGEICLKGTTLSSADRQLKTRLSEGADSQLVIDELLDGVRIAVRSWVGVVHFDNFVLQIRPKLAGDNLGLVDLIDYATGLDALKRHAAVRHLEPKGTSLFDILAALLAESCQEVLRSGLLSDYCEVEESLPVVRGRMLLQRQVLRRFGMIDRLECRYDEYLTDIIENRILLAALVNCASRVRNPGIAMHVRRLLAIFSEICFLEELDLRLARSTLVYNRMNEHYRESHGLAWLILDGLGVSDIFASGSQRCFAFMLDMNRLFEDFVTRWLGESLPSHGLRTIPQHGDSTILWDANLDRRYAKVIPDLLIESAKSPGRFLPVDAKYKLYDEKKLDQSDIYQTFLYAHAYSDKHSVLPSVLLLYPASSPAGKPHRVHVRRATIPSAELKAVPIHIPTVLAQARSKNADGIVKIIHEAFGDSIT